MKGRFTPVVLLVLLVIGGLLSFYPDLTPPASATSHGYPDIVGYEATNNLAITQTHTINIPGPEAVGDLLIALGRAGSLDTCDSSPGGGWSWYEEASGSSMCFMYKFSVDPEPTPVTTTTVFSGRSTWQVFRIRNASHFSFSGFAGTSSDSVDVPALNLTSYATIGSFGNPNPWGRPEWLPPDTTVDGLWIAQATAAGRRDPTASYCISPPAGYINMRASQTGSQEDPWGNHAGMCTATRDFTGTIDDPGTFSVSTYDHGSGSILGGGWLLVVWDTYTQDDYPVLLAEHTANPGTNPHTLFAADVAAEEGDFLVAFATWPGSKTITSHPSGWTLTVDWNGATTNRKFMIYTKVSDGTETTINPTWSSTGSVLWASFRIGGQDAYAADSCIGGACPNDVSDAPDPPLLSASETDTRLYFAYMRSGSLYNSNPTGYTRLNGAVASPTYHVVAARWANTDDEDPSPFGLNAASAWTAVTLGITSYVAPTITSAAVTTASCSVLYQYQVTADGGAVDTWSLPVAPSYLFINTTGFVSGTPSSAAIDSVTVQAENLGGTDTQAYTITVGSCGGGGGIIPGEGAGGGELNIYWGDYGWYFYQPNEDLIPPIPWQCDVNSNVLTFEETSVPAAGILISIWDFGDGSQPVTTTGNVIVHEYPGVGIYTLTYSVALSGGGIIRNSLDVTIGSCAFPTLTTPVLAVLASTIATLGTMWIVFAFTRSGRLKKWAIIGTLVAIAAWAIYLVVFA